MLRVIWDTRGYLFWLIVVSLLCLILERIRPWRPNQKLMRKQFGQDLLWLVLNGQYAGILIAYVAAYAFAWATPMIEQAKSLNLVSGQPLWAQFLVFFIVRDFLEWGVHNLLHRVPFLWEFHKVHHSIEELDWIGNFRFHWMEIVVYQGLTYFPLIILGVDGRVILAIAVVVTLIGHLNHSNLNITWGPFRYILNSPRMHVWHHDHDWPADRPKGVNFGIALSLWDWLFRTAYWPAPTESPNQQPSRLGFDNMEQFPRTFLGRLVYPISRRRRHAPPPRNSAQPNRTQPNESK